MKTFTYHKQRAYTLLEILIAVALLSVLLAVAFPNLAEFVEKRRVSSAAQQISDILSLARQTAVSRGETTAVCWNDSTSAANIAGITPVISLEAGDFALIAVNDGNNLIDRFQLPTDTIFEQTVNADCINYDISGRALAAAGGSFFVCRRSGQADDAREVRIDAAGRALISSELSSQPSCS